MSELVASIHLSSATFYSGFHVDNGTIGYVLSSFGFKVEADIRIDERFAPFWLFGTRYLIFAAWFDQ
jgi:hypothetical protein